MKRTKAVSLLLSLTMLACVAVPGMPALSVRAAEEPENPGETSGMVLDKTATANDNGSYTITLEAYATGEKVITGGTKEVPTDIVLVLDQSGSMAYDMSSYSFRPYNGKTNGEYYDLRHNGGDGNLYYQLDNGGYATVSVQWDVIGTTETYTECPSNWRNSNYWKNRDALYIKDANGDYQKVKVDRQWYGSIIFGDYRYTYALPNGDTVTSADNNGIPNFGNQGPVYVRSTVNEYRYTYTYTEQNGNQQSIGSYEGEDAVPPLEQPLYERYETSSQSRLEALKTAVQNFADSVSEKAAGKDGQLGTEDDVTHRVAVVGFASGPRNYGNTEVFVGRNQYNYDSRNLSAHYREALQDMSTATGLNNVRASTQALTASGSTYPQYGLEMAKGILDANQPAEGEERNQVVILFTDGEPGYSGYESGAATAAVNEAQELKDQGVTIYSIGIFDGADATANGIAQGNNNRNANQFMQDVSSNNGTPRDPSYYLSAADADTLNDIFEQISDQIEQGGSATTLDEHAVVRDVIADSFTLPEGATVADITLKTYRYTGENQWQENQGNPMGATASITDDGKVEVTGFDFSENWCGTETKDGQTTYRGNKLEISFTVDPKEGFLGGNQVPTNNGAGVYENAEAQNPTVTAPDPVVDVPIGEVSVTAANKNVYLLQDVSASDLQGQTTVKVGDVKLDLTELNHGLETWQNAYVDIKVEVKNADGTTVMDFTDLTNDQTYTVAVTVSPKNEGTSTQQTGSGTGSINVYKPELTFKDGEAWYGADVPDTDELNTCLTTTVWKHGDAVADTGTMGTAPALGLTITPDQSKINDGKVNTKQDVPVAVSVTLDGTNVDQYTMFQHTDCDGETCNVPEGYKFLLHTKTCQLTITKTGGAEGEPYVFTILKDDAPYSEVTIVGNDSATICELPVGSYTIQEDDGWSWRYDGTINPASGVNLSKNSPSGSITCTNRKKDDRWLNAFSDVIANVSGVSATN